MKRFERKLKKLSKESNPHAEEWLKTKLRDDFLQKDKNSVLTKRIYFSVFPFVMALIMLAVLILWIQPIQRQPPKYAEEDLVYKELTLKQVREANILLPDYDKLNEVIFIGAYIKETNELGFIKISGFYETESQYIEYSIIALIMDNINFLSRSLYENYCVEPIKIGNSLFHWRNLGLQDDIFYTAQAFGSIDIMKYYIELRSLDEVTPYDFSIITFSKDR